MATRSIQVFILSALLIFSMGSCKKNIWGCTVPYANNYNSSATANDDSCILTTKIVIWWNQSAANAYLNAGDTNIYLYDTTPDSGYQGIKYGALYTSTYWSSPPAYGSPGSCSFGYTWNYASMLHSIGFNFTVVDSTRNGEVVTGWFSGVTFPNLPATDQVVYIQVTI